jgi:hypothetical protein
VLEWARRQWPWLALGGLVSVVLLVLLLRGTAKPPDQPSAASAGSPATAQPPDPPPAEDEPPPAGAAGTVAPAGAARADAGTPSPNVRIVVKTYPPRRASVMWGNQRLGFADRGNPLVIERPRDSGPLDLVIRAPGFVPVHTRAYTFDDMVVDVRITPNDKKDTLYGYRQPLPPEDAGAPE